MRVKRLRLFSILSLLILSWWNFSILLRNLDFLLYSNSYPVLDDLLLKETTFSLNQVNNSYKTTVNAVFLGLVRNSELQGMMHTVRQIENSFNKDYNYPYVFLNEVEFTPEFMDGIRSVTSAKVEFGLIPKEHWSIPYWINKRYLRYRLWIMSFLVSYGGLESYRHMCRFNSGFFYRHDLLESFDYYWRIEPNVDYYCKLSYDPFLFMKLSGKKYGFNILAHEEMRKVNGLWKTTNDFIHEYKIKPKSLLKIFEKDHQYNGLHFW